MKNHSNFDFGNIYDAMNANYSALENVMASIYNNPNMSSEEILMQLGDVATSMLSSQMNLTDIYGDPALKNSMMNQLNGKKVTLSNALSQTQGRSK